MRIYTYQDLYHDEMQNLRFKPFSKTESHQLFFSIMRANYLDLKIVSLLGLISHIRT